MGEETAEVFPEAEAEIAPVVEEGDWLELMSQQLRERG
jgi:hypothetical protein